MTDGIGISSDIVWTFIITSVGGVITWLFNRMSAESDEKMKRLEKLHDSNAKGIGELDKRVTIIEKTYVSHEEARIVVDTLRDELYQDLDKSFTRVRERFDILFGQPKVSQKESRHYPSESPGISYGKTTD